MPITDVQQAAQVRQAHAAREWAEAAARKPPPRLPLGYRVAAWVLRGLARWFFRSFGSAMVDAMKRRGAAAGAPGGGRPPGG